MKSRDHAVQNFPDRSWRRNHWNMQRVFRLFFVHGHDSGQLMTSLDRTRTLRQIPTEDKPNEIIVRSCVRISKEKDARWKWQQQNDIGTTRRCPNDQSWRWQWLPSLKTHFCLKINFYFQCWYLVHCFKHQGWLHDDALWQVTCSMIIFNMQVL